MAGSVGKCFRGFRLGRVYVVGEPIAQQMKKTGLAYIVQFRRQTVQSGGLSKNSPLPHAQIWGLTPNFKILFYGDPHPLQMLKIS